jgi:hypothetical protein
VQNGYSGRVARAGLGHRHGANSRRYTGDGNDQAFRAVTPGRHSPRNPPAVLGFYKAWFPILYNIGMHAWEPERYPVSFWPKLGMRRSGGSVK